MSATMDAKHNPSNDHKLVAPGVYHFETFPINWYVVEQEGRLTIVDAGFPGYYQVLVDGLRSIGHDLKDIDAVILTHIHADHTGFAERLRRDLDIPVFVHESDMPASRKIPRIPPIGFIINFWRPFVLRYILIRAVQNGVTRTEDIPRATSYKDGEVLKAPGKLRAIHIPGHTEGHCMLYMENNSVIFTGDALVTLNLLTGEHVEPHVPYRYLNDNYVKAQRSIAAIADAVTELGTVTMLPGHGRPWKGTVRQAIEAARKQ